MGTQKILALKEVRTFHHGCQVYTWVDPVEKGLNLQPGLTYKLVPAVQVNCPSHRQLHFQPPLGQNYFTFTFIRQCGFLAIESSFLKRTACSPLHSICAIPFPFNSTAISFCFNFPKSTFEHSAVILHAFAC